VSAAQPTKTATPEATKPPKGVSGGGTGDDSPDWAIALLAALGALGLGSIGVAAAQRSNEGVDVETWDDLARKEYAKPDEPISARASDLTKIGAPVAAFITAVAAGLGGWVADGPAGPRVFAVSIVIAVAVGGLFYVFAADFKSRAAVEVARLNNLSKFGEAEAKASAAVLAEAHEAQAVAAATAEAAERCCTDATAAETRAENARDAADARSAEATRRIAEAEAKVTDLTDDLADARERLCRCAELASPSKTETHAAPSYLTLGGVDATAGGTRTKVYGIESAGAEIVRYLVLGADGRLRWVSEADVSEVTPKS
jgi:hypothetical protein